MKQNVWIINHYAGGMLFDCGGRHYNFAKYLKLAGYDPVVFACNAIHGKAETFFPDTALWQEHMAEDIEVPFVFVRGRTYLGNGKQRVLNMIDFYRNMKKTAKEYAKLHGKPDVIYASSVHPLTLVAGIQLAKKFGVKCVCEVRDLWPESIVAYSSRLDKKNPIIRLLYQGEKWIYKKADNLVFTVEGAYDYIVEQGWEKAIPSSKVHYINNGIDLQTFQYNFENYRFQDKDLDNPTKFKVLYAGSIRKANHVRNIVDAARLIMQEGITDIQFLVYGDGEERKALEMDCPSNVQFKGKIDKNCVPYLLSKGDVNLWNFVEVPLLRYGASPNKLFEYLASGRPIIATGHVGYDLVLQKSAGIEANSSAAKDISEAILTMYRMPREQRMQMGNNAYEAAKEFDFRVLTEKLIKIIGD